MGPVRKLLVLVAAVMLASLVAVVPAGSPVARAATNPKVVIIVGATGSTTPTYRSDADSIAAAAAKYTTNVVKIYSPSATWTKVKNAVYGASLIVYLGHGNGWPSPYTYDPNYTTKDGFGLNYDNNGDGKLTDSEIKYYGEPSIATLQPAPNAVVLLFHLCYASGNPEGGAIEPDLSKAKQRVDNYASAFLKAGARAVLAIGHSHAAYYMDALFTTHQTMRSYFDHAPDVNGHNATYTSTRSPGSTFRMDPESAGYYYRSITGNLDLRTEDVTGAAFIDTAKDPTTMAVPGNASPKADGTPVYGSAAAAAAGTGATGTVNAADRVRVDAKESVVSSIDGSPVYRMHLDGGPSGWMPGSSLTPRDSLAPQVWTVTDGTGFFSPNGDGRQDSYSLSVKLSESSSWALRILDGSGHEMTSQSGSSNTAALTWSPAPGVSEGTYTWTLKATDAWSNGPLNTKSGLEVDVTAPSIGVAESATVPNFTPNGDGSSDTVSFATTSNEPGQVVGTIRDAADKTVTTVSAAVSGGGATLTWDGKAAGAYVPDGTYSIAFVAQDPAGNRSGAQTRTVEVYAALSFVRTSKTVFFPQDADALAPTTSLTFTLRSAATVTWTVRNSAGTVVRTIKSAAPLAAGPYAFTWNGKDDAGAYVARGSYRSHVVATDGTLSHTHWASTLADAFKVTVSDTTPARGQRITVTALSAESLGSNPKLTVYQPGISSYSVTMSKIDTRTYRVSVTLKSSSTGTLRFRVAGVDTGARSQSSNLYLPLH